MKRLREIFKGGTSSPDQHDVHGAQRVAGTRSSVRALLPAALAGVIACAEGDLPATHPSSPDFDWAGFYEAGGECTEGDGTFVTGNGCAGAAREVNTNVYCGADYDGDGFSIDEGDCHDGNPAIYPDAEEFCDGIDTDCDGNLDNGYPDCDPEGDDDDVVDDDDSGADDDDSGADDDDASPDDDDSAGDDDDATLEGCQLLVEELEGGGEITWALEIGDPDGIPFAGMSDVLAPEDTEAFVTTDNSTNPMWYVQMTGPNGPTSVDMTLTCEDPSLEVEVAHKLSGNGFVGPDFDTELALTETGELNEFTPVTTLTADGTITTVTTAGDLGAPQEAFIVHTP